MKKKRGCGSLIFVFFVFVATLGVLGGDSGSSTPKVTATKATVVTKIPSVTISEKPTAKPTVEPTENPLVIYLRYPELGEYGRYYVFNAFVEKATKADMNTVIQCFVPAGTYTVTNVGRYPTFVYGYSKETHITSAGWEEPVDGWVSEMLKVGDSCEIAVEEGYYIKLLDNDTFRLEQKNTK